MQPKFPLLKRLEVNGAKTAPLYKFLKDAIWMPCDGDPRMICEKVEVCFALWIQSAPPFSQ